MMKRTLLIFTILTLAITAAVAQTSFDVQTPRNVEEGNRFSLTFSLKNGDDATAPQAPQLEGCTMLYGPATSTMQSYQVVNGRASSSTSTDYTFTYRADKAGNVVIPPVTISAGGKKYTSRQVSFTILPPSRQQQPGAGGASSGSTTRRNQAQAAGSDFHVGSNDVIVRIIMSRNQAYEQEAIECTIKLYTKYSISSFMVKTQPSFDGFLIEDLNVQSYLGEREHYNGDNYYTAVLKRCLLYPQKSGKLTINSGQYDVTVQRQVLINDWPFPRTIVEDKDIEVNSNSASIQINPLPQPQPDGFSGAVGKFSIDSRLVGNSFKTNEAATLIYTVKGTGNIKYIHEPTIDFPSEFELYTPRSESDARVAGNNMTGTMTVEYTFVPQSVGKFKIGADEFVYFDPSTKEYVTLTTPSYDIDVKQGAVVPSSGGGNSKQEILSKNTDIHHIKLGDKYPRKSHSYIVKSGWYWPMYVVMAVVLAVIIYLYAKSAREAANVTGRRLAQANKVARKRLKAARTFLNSHQYEKFYEELLKAIWGYFGDKLAIPASQLSRDNIASMLADYGAPEQLGTDLIAVLDECEMARYTPQQSPDQAETVFNQASSVINRMEGIKQTKRS